MIVRKISLISLLAGSVAASLGSGIAGAVTPNKHPYYTHARSDLRQAELLLQAHDESNVEQETKIASQQVHQAIEEIDKAAVLDKQDVQQNPHIDSYIKNMDRFRAIYKLLRSAEKDISQEEDAHVAKPWRNRATANIERAKHSVEVAASRDVIDDLQRTNY